MDHFQPKPQRVHLRSGCLLVTAPSRSDCNKGCRILEHPPEESDHDKIASDENTERHGRPVSEVLVIALGDCVVSGRQASSISMLLVGCTVERLEVEGGYGNVAKEKRDGR